MEIIVCQEQGRVPVTIFRLKERINLGNVEQLVGKARQVFDIGARDLLIGRSMPSTSCSILDRCPNRCM
jgi:hypothetical protein